MKTPIEYQAPLRSRTAIADFIIGATEQREYDYRPHPFCFYVKMRRLDFSFDHLLSIYRRFNDDAPHTHLPEWLEAARERFDELDGTASFCEHVFSSVRERFLDQDHVLFDGTVISCDFSFEGRSQGWLSLNRFEDYDFTEPSTYSQTLRELLVTMPYHQLRRLYKFILTINDAVDKREDELKLEAAHTVFSHLTVCIE